MISLLPSQALTGRSMKISGDLRQYAVRQGISEEEALEKGMEEKGKEFVDSGAEVYTSAR